MSSIAQVPDGDRSPLRKIGPNEKSPSRHSQACVSKRIKLDLAPPPPPPTTTTAPTTTTSTCPPVTHTIEYPQTVDIPSKGLIKSLYNKAQTCGKGDQIVLTDAGLLSLEEVLLPAVAYQEDQALKRVQAKVQRDLPAEYAGAVVACRKAVYDCVGAAMTAVAASRQKRQDLQAKLDQEQAQEQALALQQKQQLQERLREKQQQERAIRAANRKRELIKKLPRNQEMWREVVYLMTELTTLQKEERRWTKAKEQLSKRVNEEDAAPAATVPPVEETPPDTAANSMAANFICKDLELVTQTVQDITLSSIRIHQALTICSNIATESDRVRKELYQRYRQDHQFHGYQGVKDPKGLLRALSQSQDVVEQEEE